MGEFVRGLWMDKEWVRDLVLVTCVGKASDLVDVVGCAVERVG